MKENKASRNDIMILTDAIQDAIENNCLVKGWFVQNLDYLIKTENIDRFYQIKERGFAGSIGYVLTKHNQVLLLEHAINNVNTSFCITDYYVNHDIIRDNFYWLYRDEINQE